jgi:hypothetical protein
MADHARTFGASSFERLMLCPGSAVLAADAPRTSSAYAAEGTLIHLCSASVLNGSRWPAFGTEFEVDGHVIAWTEDMQDCGQQYVDYVDAVNRDAQGLWVEQRVSFAAALGIQPDADDGFGTADAIVAKGTELIVVDLKCGRGVDVQAEDNPQLQLYALGALELLDGVAGDFDTVRCVIVQPRAGGVKEWVISKADLYAWATVIGAEAVRAVRSAQLFGGDNEITLAPFLRPGEKQCRFCPAKATCPALRDDVVREVFTVAPATPDEFASLDTPHDPKPDDGMWLSVALTKVDLIEDWCKAVRAEAERRLLAGDEVPGFKVVQGKRGNRGWTDAAEVEKTFKETFRLKIGEMYDLKLISPTTAEKLHKAKVIGPRQWAKVTGLITQSEGKPHVAPASDPRPALDIRPVRDDFSDLAGELA